MKRITLSIIIVFVMLTACEKEDFQDAVMETPQSYETTMPVTEPVAVDQTPAEFETPAVDDLPSFTFEMSVHENLPPFTFDVYENKVSDSEFFPIEYDVRISCPALSDYIPQSIKISCTDKWDEEYRERYIDLVDIDFDGYTDIQAAFSRGNANFCYLYYRWNVFAGQGYGEFEEESFFNIMTIGYELYPDTKQIISASHDSAVSYTREIYQLVNTQNGSEYQMVHSENITLQDGALNYD